MPGVLNDLVASPLGETTMTPPLPPSSFTTAITASAAALAVSPFLRMRAPISWATPARMKYSPDPVAATAPARPPASLPAPNMRDPQLGPARTDGGVGKGVWVSGYILWV